LRIVSFCGVTNFVFHTKVTACDSHKKSEADEKVDGNDRADGVAEAETNFSVRHKRGEANEVIHHQHHYALTEHLVHVLARLCKWLHATQDDDLRDDVSSHQGDLPNDG